METAILISLLTLTTGIAMLEISLSSFRKKRIEELTKENLELKKENLKLERHLLANEEYINQLRWNR